MAHEDNVIDFYIEFLESIKIKLVIFLRDLNFNISFLPALENYCNFTAFSASLKH